MKSEKFEFEIKRYLNFESQIINIQNKRRSYGFQNRKLHNQEDYRGRHFRQSQIRSPLANRRVGRSQGP